MLGAFAFLTMHPDINLTPVIPHPSGNPFIHHTRDTPRRAPRPFAMRRILLYLIANSPSIPIYLPTFCSPSSCHFSGALGSALAGSSVSSAGGVTPGGSVMSVGRVGEGYTRPERGEPFASIEPFGGPGFANSRTARVLGSRQRVWSTARTVVGERIRAPCVVHDIEQVPRGHHRSVRAAHRAGGTETGLFEIKASEKTSGRISSPTSFANGGSQRIHGGAPLPFDPSPSRLNTTCGAHPRSLTLFRLPVHLASREPCRFTSRQARVPPRTTHPKADLSKHRAYAAPFVNF